MGRTAPTLRMALREELERLKRVSRAERDPKVKEALDWIVSVGEKLLDAYSNEPVSDAMEVIVMSALVELFIKVRELSSAQSTRDELKLSSS